MRRELDFTCCQFGFATTDFAASMQQWRDEKGVGPWWFSDEITEQNYICGLKSFHVADLDAAIERLSRVLSPGPWFVTERSDIDCGDERNPRRGQYRRAFANSRDSGNTIIDLIETPDGCTTIWSGFAEEDPENYACWFSRPATSLQDKVAMVMQAGYEVRDCIADTRRELRSTYLEHPDRPGRYVKLGSAGIDFARKLIAVRDAAMLWNGDAPIRPFD